MLVHLERVYGGMYTPIDLVMIPAGAEDHRLHLNDESKKLDCALDSKGNIP